MAVNQEALSPRKSPQVTHKTSILAVLILGAFVAILNQTLLNVAIPHLMSAFNVSADTVQWLSTAYMLTNGVLIPITAFLIGTFTTRQLFITAMTLFTAGSFICSIAPTFSVILLGRIVQAAGAGIIMPLMMTVILDLFPPESRGKAMGTMAIAMFFAPAVGPTLSGWMIEQWSWRLLFYVVMPIAIVDIVLAAFLLKNVSRPVRPRFDFPGFFSSLIGFSTLLYGFSEAGSKGWHSAVVVASIVTGVIFLVLFVLRELTAEEPMLNLGVFRYSVFSLTTIIGSIVNMAMFGAMILTPIYLQNIRGFTPLQSGLLMLPGALLMGVMSPISGALFDRIGARPLAIVGLAITAVTTWEFTKLTGTTTYGHVMLLYTMRMFGMSFIAMTIQTAGMNQLPMQMNRHGTAASNTARTVASSLGTAFLVTVMTTRTHVHMADYANVMTTTNPFFSNAVQQLTAAFGMQVGPQAAQGMTTYVLYGLAMKESTIKGINDAFIIATLLTIVALILSFFIKRVVRPGRTVAKAPIPPEPDRISGVATAE